MYAIFRCLLEPLLAAAFELEAELELLEDEPQAATASEARTAPASSAATRARDTLAKVFVICGLPPESRCVQRLYGLRERSVLINASVARS
jgi:hypothetical protein